MSTSSFLSRWTGRPEQEDGVSPEMSFLEMLDILNEDLIDLQEEKCAEQVGLAVHFLTS